MSEHYFAEYRQIRRYMMNLILRSEGKSTRLPTFKELADQFEVSRPTVNKAIKELIAEGYIISKPGIGTFTNPEKSLMFLGEKIPVVGIIIGDGQVVHFDRYLSFSLGELLKHISMLPAIVHYVTQETSNVQDAIKRIQLEQLDALVVSCCSFMSEPARNAGMRVIGADNYDQIFPENVLLDYEDWGYRCGKQLLKENRRNIVFLHDSPSWNRSYPGFRRAFDETGVPLNEKFFLKKSSAALDELRNIIQYGVKIDAVCDTVMTNNEVANLLMEENPELAKSCALIRNALSTPQNYGFHELCYDVPFSDFAAKVAEMVRLQLNNEPAGMDIRKVNIPLLIK